MFVNKNGLFRPAGGDIPVKPGIAGCMAALAGSRVSFISWCSWSKHPPHHYLSYTAPRPA
jgi:hypothetical protein